MPSQVQDAMSSGDLADFNVPVSVVLITQAQDWQTRQQIAYAAIKGLLQGDFLGLADWQQQINFYSLANPAYLTLPYNTIKALAGLNQNVLRSLVLDPVLGLVGEFLTQIYGIQKTFVAPADLLNDSADPGSELGQ
jgi:hypothetical protein